MMFKKNLLLAYLLIPTTITYSFDYTVTVNPDFTMTVVGSAPSRFFDLGQVVFGLNGQFFVPTPDYPTSEHITAILTNPNTVGDSLRIYGTIPFSISLYTVQQTDISVRSDGRIFLNTVFSGIFTDPVSPGQPLTVYGVPPGVNGRISQLGPRFDSNDSPSAPPPT